MLVCVSVLYCIKIDKRETKRERKRAGNSLLIYLWRKKKYCESKMWCKRWWFFFFSFFLLPLCYYQYVQMNIWIWTAYNHSNASLWQRFNHIKCDSKLKYIVGHLINSLCCVVSLRRHTADLYNPFHSSVVTLSLSLFSLFYFLFLRKWQQYD